MKSYKVDYTISVFVEAEDEDSIDYTFAWECAQDAFSNNTEDEFFSDVNEVEKVINKPEGEY